MIGIVLAAHGPLPGAFLASTSMVLGELPQVANSRNVASNCDLSPEEVEDTEKLHQQGIRIWIQLVPFGSQKPIEWEAARKKAGLK